VTTSYRPSNLWNVSSRYDRDDLPVLPEEDDWFATPFQEPMVTDEVAWQDDEPEPPPRPAPDGLAQRQIVIVLAVLAIIAVIVILILLVKAVSGSDNTPTATTPVTTATTPTDTTPANTTPADTTPTDTTPTDTTPTNTTPTGGGVTSVPTEATLRPGTSGSSVTDLQNALNQLGYDVGTADGSYGAATTAAVTAFQKDKGLTQDGTAGPATLAAINTALAAG
jgi:murein L,D-transpeptidase YcbB/YkuD